MEKYSKYSCTLDFQNLQTFFGNEISVGKCNFFGEYFYFKISAVMSTFKLYLKHLNIFNFV